MFLRVNDITIQEVKEKKCFVELWISQYTRGKRKTKKMFLIINDITIQEVKEKQNKNVS